MGGTTAIDLKTLGTFSLLNFRDQIQIQFVYFFLLLLLVSCTYTQWVLNPWPHPPLSTYKLQGEEVPIELELNGLVWKLIILDS